jgi:hypothetical protein
VERSETYTKFWPLILNGRYLIRTGDSWEGNIKMDVNLNYNGNMWPDSWDSL